MYGSILMKLKMLNRRNGALRIRLLLWIPSKSTYVSMYSIFDTGASKTIISTDLAKQLKIIADQSSDTTTVTATGSVSLDAGNLPKLKIGSREISNVPVSIADLPKELKTHCVLGMNVLREFLIGIDSIDRTISLAHRPYPKKYHLENYSVSMLADVTEKDS